MVWNFSGLLKIYFFCTFVYCYCELAGVKKSLSGFRNVFFSDEKDKEVESVMNTIPKIPGYLKSVDNPAGPSTSTTIGDATGSGGLGQVVGNVGALLSSKNGVACFIFNLLSLSN